jgi:hypothetical protein
MFRAYDAVSAYEDVVEYDDVPLNCDVVDPVQLLNEDVNKYPLVADAGILRAYDAVVAYDDVP